jgi:hypothetical protein
MSTKGLSDELTLDHGILQGETLNPFIIVLDFAIRRALDKDASLSDIKNGQWRLFLPDRKGPRSPALYLTDMDLADDIGLYGQQIIDAVIRETKVAAAVHQCGHNLFRGDLVDTPVNSVSIDRGTSSLWAPMSGRWAATSTSKAAG